MSADFEEHEVNVETEEQKRDHRLILEKPNLVVGGIDENSVSARVVILIFFRSLNTRLWRSQSMQRRK